jgi:SAM-dependent methyltransferase
MTIEWSHGYVTDVQYTAGFYRETTPLWLKFLTVFVNQRQSYKENFNFCELGCGQGLNLNLIAAVNTSDSFYGVDFNPSHIANARKLAEEAGLTNVKFFEDDFIELAAHPPDRWPQFDYIVLHGIYTWVDRDVQKALMKFIASRLKPEGIVYISYNALPGWAAAGPTRKILYEFAKRTPGKSDERFRAAIDFLDRLRQAGALFFNIHPPEAARIDKLKNQDINYLPHEYLHDSWYLHYHMDVANDLLSAKCDYIGSATLSDNVHNTLPEACRPILSSVTDIGFKETLRDIMVNQSFRRDVFVKGRNSMLPQEHLQAIQRLKFCLIAPKEEVKLEFNVGSGNVTGKEEIYRPVIDALIGSPLTIGELNGLPQLKQSPVSSVMEICLLLMHSGQAHLMADGTKSKAQETARKFNQAVLKRAVMGGSSTGILASPVIGSGVNLDIVKMIAAHVLIQQPTIQFNALVNEVWKVMESQGRKFIKEGRTLETVEENLKELSDKMRDFVDRRVPLLKMLKVIS